MIDVEQLISNILFLFQARIQELGIQVSVQSQENLKIQGSSTQLAQVLMHVLKNSFDSMKSTPEKILKIQMPPNDKLKYADFAIDNNGNLKYLEGQVKKIIGKLDIN